MLTFQQAAFPVCFQASTAPSRHLTGIALKHAKTSEHLTVRYLHDGPLWTLQNVNTLQGGSTLAGLLCST